MNKLKVIYSNQYQATLKQQPLPNISTPQARGSQTIDYIFFSTQKSKEESVNYKVRQNKSNISFLRNDKSQIKQDQYFNSPLLSSSQMIEVERQSKNRKNELYSQMLSENPYQYAATNQRQGVSDINIDLLDVNDKSKINQLLIETSNFSDQLSSHVQRIKPTNTITQRQDVIKLAQWIDVMMKQIVETTKKTKNDDQLKQIEQVFSLSLKELIREISIDCVEKSILLEKVWNQYNNFNHTILRTIEEEKEAEENAHLEQMKLLHQTYQNSINFLEDKLKNKSADYDKMLLKYQKKKVKCKQLENINGNIINQLKNQEQELYELRMDQTSAYAEKERLYNHLRFLEADYQKISDQLLSKNNDVRIAMNRPKRQSTYNLETQQVENCKFTTTEDLVTTMNILTTSETNTEDPPITISQLIQTEFIGFRSIGFQISMDKSREQTVESMQSDPRGNNDELRKLREKKFELEELLRLETQNLNEQRKQRQQLQRENEAKAIKMMNQENTINSQQIEIDRLLSELNSLNQEQIKTPGIISLQESDEPNLSLNPIKRPSQTQAKTLQQPQVQPITNKFVQSQTNSPTNQQKITETETKKPAIVLPNNSSQEQPQSLKKSKVNPPKPRVSENLQKQLDLPKKSTKMIRKSAHLTTDQLQQQSTQSKEQQQQNQQIAQQQEITPTQEQKQNIQTIEVPEQFQLPDQLLIPKDIVNHKRKSVQHTQENQQIQKNDKQKDPKENHYVDAALEFMNSLSEQFWQNPDLVEPGMPLANVLRLIQQFYKDRFTARFPIYALCYEFYMNTFGLKNIAEQKMTTFCSTIFHFRSIPRIKLFGRFLYLFDRLNDEDLDFYIQSLTQLDEYQNPQNMIQCAQNQNYVSLSYKKALNQLEVLKDQADEIHQILKQNVKKNENGQQILDLDFYFQEALEQYQLLQKIHKDNFKELFIAVDVNDDNTINLDEFIILLELLEGPIGLKTYKKLFLEQCQEKNGLSFYQFGLFCMHNQLFTKEKQNKFSKITDIDEQMIQLKLNWNDYRRIVTKRLKMNCQFSEYYQDLIRKLNDALQKDQNYSWLLWRILDEQSKKIYLDGIVSQIIGQQFNYIFDKFDSLQ